MVAPAVVIASASGGYLAFERSRPPAGYELGSERDFLGMVRLGAGGRVAGARVLLTEADQWDLVYFLDVLDRRTGGFPYHGHYSSPGGELRLRSTVDGVGHRASRWAIDVGVEARGRVVAATLELDSFLVGRVAWDFVDFLPGVSDAGMDWPNLPDDVVSAVLAAVEAWPPEQAQRDPEALHFPMQALAGHLYRGDNLDELLEFVETQVREQLGIEPERERERALVEQLVAWRAARVAAPR